jgi:hypothetical protein
MPGFLTDHTNNRVLDCILGGVKIEPPKRLYFGLSLTRASKIGFVVEPRAPSYARSLVSNDLIRFRPAIGGKKSNSLPIEFPLALEYWGEVASVFVADEPEGGNVLAMADLFEPKTIEADPIHRPKIATDALFLSHC